MAGAVARKYLIGHADADQAAQQPGAEQPAPSGPPVQPLSVIKSHAPTVLPAISFMSADGGAHTLEQYRGHGVVLNLWATWCVPCVSEMPALDALARTLAPAGIQVLTVSLDRGGADAVRPFYAAHGIHTLPMLLDPHSTILAALGLDGIPTTLLVNAGGMEVARLQGPVDWASPEAAALIGHLLG
ncbi:TlpA disulfide reductase family protein [Lichenicola sp.]|uniref:TlpA disulfide reductase family protein n=1 Tax=Lichenicola sp. TaxID=2804529 RepID=UPI003B00FD5A